MSDVFPEPIRKLPEADIPLDGVRGFLAQGEDHQVLFMEFERDVEVPEHSHGAQWAIVVAGKIEVTIDGARRTCRKGDSYFIPAGTPHSARVEAGYADITFFSNKNRYRQKMP